MANDINLIPPPDLEKKKRINRQALWAGLIAAVLILGGYFGIFIPIDAKARLTRELNANRVDQAAYQKAVNDHMTLINDIKTASDKVNDLEANLPEAFDWHQMFLDIQGCIPPDVTFRSFQFQERGLYIIGDYVRDEDMARLISKIRGLDQIEGARILSITKNDDDATYSFEMSCDLPASVYPEAPPPSSEEGDTEGAAS